MKTTIALLLAATALSAPAFAQTSAPATSAGTTSAAPMNATGEWRASKLVGVNVYNDQNASVGEIDEVLIDKSGKVAGFVIGVGGFLGMGEHAVLMPFDQVKFVNEPVHSASATITKSTNTANMATTTNRAPATDSPATTGTITNTARVANTRSKSEKWYPDHAVISATKDQLKAMPQFKYD
jgi:sporulation protein YlmC with PRC-barrel domain